MRTTTTTTATTFYLPHIWNVHNNICWLIKWVNEKQIDKLNITRVQTVQKKQKKSYSLLDYLIKTKGANIDIIITNK